MPEEQREIILHVSRLANPQAAEVLMFEIHHGKKAEKGQVFIPLTNEQADNLEGFNRTHKPGYATLTLLHDQKRIKWNKFYPLGMETKEKKPTGMGIGSRIHHAIIEYLAKNYQLQQYTLVHDRPSDSRKKQLRLMGITYTTPY